MKKDDEMKEKKDSVMSLESPEQEIGENDEPPPGSSNSLFDRIFRVVYSPEAYKVLHGAQEGGNVYFGGGRKFMGMARSR